jgi:hypothetical protein
MPWPLGIDNLFSSGSTTQQDRNSFGFVDDGLPGGKQTFANVKLASQNFRTEIMAPKATEGEGRPPYLHVGSYLRASEAQR